MIYVSMNVIRVLLLSQCLSRGPNRDITYVAAAAKYAKYIILVGASAPKF